MNARKFFTNSAANWEMRTLISFENCWRMQLFVWAVEVNS